MNHIGQRIKKLRQAKGMTQQELGEILGVQKAAVQKYESSPNPNLTADKIRLLCQTFRVYPRLFVYADEQECLDLIFNLNTAAFEALNRDRELLRCKALHIDETLGSRFLELNFTLFKLNEKGFSCVEAVVNDLVKIEEYRLPERSQELGRAQ